MADFYPPSKVLHSVLEARAAGHCIVFTNGCFDLLHPGHIRNLQQARSFGDRLVVGLNTDDSVTRLKGQGRPILPYAARAEMLLALSCVDWVLGFGTAEDDTPLRLITEVAPDVLAKGADYDLAEIVGADAVIARGGRVAQLDYHLRWSTTRLIATIKAL